MLARLDNNFLLGGSSLLNHLQRLNELAVGQQFTVSRIPEELEFTPGMLEFLERTTLVPGTSAVVHNRARTGEMTVTVDGANIDVDSFACSRIFVTV